MPATSFQAILDRALADYRDQIGVELDKHPFVNELQGCDFPDDVLKLLEVKANAFRVYRNGNRKLIDWLSPVVRVVHTLSGVLGEAVSLVPFSPAKAIFVGVDVLITAADGVSSSYDALVDLFECIGNFLKRLGIYDDIPMTPLMTDIVAKIMAEVLSVFALATKQMRQSRFKKFATKLLKENEIEAVLQRLDRLTREEGRMTVAQTFQVVHGLVDNIKVVMNDGKASTDGIREALDEIQQIASELRKIRRDLMQKYNNSWLRPPNPSENYNIGCENHQDGTAEWFFLTSVFAEWNAKSSLLWIHGKLGSGKSILLSSIIRKIDGKCKEGSASMAYFYFDFRDTKKQHLRGLLSSLVFQLSAESDPCNQTLSRLYSDHAGGTREPSEDALSQCLVEMLKSPGQPAGYIIIDALDECPNISGAPTAREKVLKFLEDLVNLKLPNVHICVSSRPEIDIQRSLEPLEPFRMSLHDESGQQADISSYVNGFVRSDQRMRRWREEDRQLVIDTVSDKADGMFRWVFCQLEILRRKIFPGDIRKALNDMPKTLDETYEHTLLAIDGEVQQYTQRLFQCLAVAVKPLRVEELADILAVQIDPGALPEFYPDWRLGDAEETVLSFCSNLISVVDVDGSRVVQFSHFSVKEFLTSDRLAARKEPKDLSGYHIVQHSAHTILAQASLGVLLHLDDHVDRDHVKSLPLSSYAAQYWVNHGQFEGVSSTIQVAMEQLFNPDKPHFRTWVWIHDMDDPWRGSMLTTHPKRPEAAPLYYAVLCGFRQLMEHLIASNPGDIDARGGYYGSPLSAAFVKGDIEIASLLLQRGAGVNVVDKYGASPLHQASESGRIDIVRLLLERNADVDPRDTKGNTPLNLASSVGGLGVLHLLLQHGADVNSPDEDGSSPLMRAAGSGHLDVVQTLIGSGADVGSRSNNGRTPLHSASQEGHVEVAELLIQRGADVGSLSNNGRTPLHSASLKGHVEVAELLIQHGADVGSLSNNGSTPLDFSSEKGHVKMTKLLIQHGADVGSRDKDGWTPLHSASQNGHVKVAELLIERGADVGSRSDKDLTPLHSASQDGHVKVAELLIHHGADVGSRDEDGWTPLYSASHEGQVKMAAELLIQHGADVGSRSNNGQIPLHSASQKGHVKVAELLIQHGADVGSRSNNGRTPLHLAACEGRFDIVKLLLESGADRNICDDKNRTPSDLASDNEKLEVANFLSRSAMSPDGEMNPTAPSSDPQNQRLDVVQPLRPRAENVESSNNEKPLLCTASINGQIDVVRSLLDHGSDIEARDSHHRTPLALASQFGQLEVAELLIECHADVNSRDVGGWTPLHHASAEGQLHVVRLLLDRNADINALERDRTTALDFASSNGHLEVVELLLERGADANVQNIYGRTAREEALASGNGRIAELLSVHGAREEY